MMAGIYVHIPFCRKACHYCDFHFSTSFKTKDAVLAKMLSELEQRKSDLKGEIIETIYFGGGTPSLLSSVELKKFIELIRLNYDVSANAEVTLEANPEDISKELAISWYNLGINRLSIGIQSFNDEILSWMNRAHNVDQAFSSVKHSQDAGISNISIDLIYGVLQRNMDAWKTEVSQALSLNTTHLSAYCLTIEPKTAFGKKAAQGEILSSPNAESSEEFLTLIELGNKQGMNLYEISNFAKDGFISKHNSNYWKGVNYLGIGPGAHSFISNTRSWNISNNALYAKGNFTSESEVLTPKDRYNEYVMTGLRRKEGIEKDTLLREYQVNLDKEFSEVLSHYSSTKDLILDQNRVYLTHKGLLLADLIAIELFLTNE